MCASSMVCATIGTSNRCDRGGMARSGPPERSPLCVAAVRPYGETRCNENIGLITALNPYIGYDNSTRLAREALLGGRSVLELVREERLLDDAMLAEILRPENMIAPRLAPLAV